MNINKLENDIMKLAEALDDMHNRAVLVYTPIVDDICNRNASEKEVDNLLTWMFDFVGHERINSYIQFDNNDIIRDCRVYHLNYCFCMTL